MITKFTQATALLFLVATSSAFAQCMMVELPLADRVQPSKAIFEGKVISKTSFWNNEHTNIYTSNIIEVYKVFKGNVNSSVEVVTPGGQVETNMEVVTPSLELSEGEIGTFFGEPANVLSAASQISISDRYEPYAGPQGFIRYDLVDNIGTDPFKKYSNIENDVYSAISRITGQAFKTIKPFVMIPPVAHRTMASSITSFSPATITAGTRSTLTINGSGFGATFTNAAKVQFKFADDGGNTYISVDTSTKNGSGPGVKNIISWSDNQIQVLVPSKAGTGTIRVIDATGAVATSSTSLTVPYGQITIYDQQSLYVEARVKVRNQNTKGGLTFQYTPSMAANPSAKEAFERALRTWRCSTLMNYEISPTNTSTTCNNQADGINIVGFDNGSCQLSTNILGLTNTYYSACSSGGTWYWVLSGADVRFATTPTGGSWNYGPGASTGNQYDFETIVMHELGHAHLIAHSILPGALMHWNRNYATDVRTPSADDLTNGNDVVARSITTNPCGSAGVMIKLTSGTCLATGENEIPASAHSVSVYPNPSFTEVSFNFTNFDLSKGKTGVIIYDPLGKEVLSLNDVQKSVLTIETGLPEGIYFYSILQNSQRVDSGKLTVVKQ